MWELACAALVLPLAAAASERRTPVVAAVERVKHAVVNVATEELVQRRVRPRASDPFEEFYRNFFEPPRVVRKYQVASLGSGAIIDPRGYAVTNFHVIARGARIKVGLADGRELVARVVGADPDSDLAVLAIQSDAPLPAAPLGASADLMIGETTIAIGNPFGFSHTVTTGVVSALRRSIRAEDRSFFDFIQTDAAINPGNSGGPLCSLDGEVIGINTAIYGEGRGIGFAIPVDRVKHIAGELIVHGEVREGWIGLCAADLPGGRGVVVSDVDPGSPAHRAGVATGEAVASIGGVLLRDADEFRWRMREVAPGGSVRLDLVRRGVARSVEVLAAEFPLAAADELLWRRVGLEIVESSAGRGDSVLVVRGVRRGSPAARTGLLPGDVLRALNAAEVSTLATLRQAVRRVRRCAPASFTIQRGYVVEEVPLAL